MRLHAIGTSPETIDGNQTTSPAPAPESVHVILAKGQSMTELLTHQKYEALIARCRALRPVTVAVAHPCDEVSLHAAAAAARAGIIVPVLVGPVARITMLAATLGVDLSGYRLVDAPHSHASAARAVELVRAGDAQALMKGSLHTDELLAEVVRADTGLRTARRLSHVFIMDVPTYPKPLFITDAAVNIRPTLEQKADIAQNAIDLAHALGIARPKVAILSAVETVSSKLPSTLDAAALCKMAERGQITGALLDGPLALDNAISPEAARLKHLDSAVAGDADILLVPDLEAGNMLAKELTFLANADAAGIVLGARVPVILTSRADSERTRLASCAVAALVAAARTAAVPVAAPAVAADAH
ncbi:phosphate acetyltransferase [Burkholderia cenocepacia]|uniref:phosphate acetyltransferase n=1 Tax=Burkholderia cenocepacia TaxID=95486 RepID=UPI001CF1ECFA|nr:phosphate acetyltransferase [Burkholderia cenocepacia]MCA8408580.1 phosphate acetyltransferase [Burkholderia cenocepacia]MEB2607332.1 phosphate acetyltransferase [Burkholderia cenocepacia]